MEREGRERDGWQEWGGYLGRERWGPGFVGGCGVGVRGGEAKEVRRFFVVTAVAETRTRFFYTRSHVCVFETYVDGSFGKTHSS